MGVVNQGSGGSSLPCLIPNKKPCRYKAHFLVEKDITIKKLVNQIYSMVEGGKCCGGCEGPGGGDSWK